MYTCCSLACTIYISSKLFFFHSSSFPFCYRGCIKKQKPCIPWVILNLLWSFIIEGTSSALICRNSDWVFRSPKKQLKIQLEVSSMVFSDIRLFYFICQTLSRPECDRIHMKKNLSNIHFVLLKTK